MNELFDISGRVIVVTGATGVLAGGTARHLQKQGAAVVYLGRNPENLAEAEREAGEISPDHLCLVCDVLDPSALDEARRRTLERFGRIDALINGAGGNLPGATVAPERDLFDLDIGDYDKVVDLNLKGTVLPTLTFCKAFAERRSGCVVNFSSMAATQAITRVVGYSNAKAAIDNFTRWMAAELALRHGDGIRVNAIAPGFFLGKQNRALLVNEDGTHTPRGEKIIARTPFRRFGRMEEVYGTVHYLVSDAAAFVTGAVIPVDGGFSSFSGV